MWLFRNTVVRAPKGHSKIKSELHDIEVRVNSRGYFNFVCQVRGKTDLLYLKLVEKAKPFLFDQKTMLNMFISWDSKKN